MAQEGTRTDAGGPIAALIGGLMIIAGSLLVWAKVSITMADVGHLSTSATGMQTGDGKITLALGVLVAAVALVGLLSKRAVLGIGPAIVGIAGGGFVAVLGVMNAQDLKNTAMDEVVRKAGLSPATFTESARAILANAMDVTAGWGLYLVILGGAVALIGGIWAAVAHRNAQRAREAAVSPISEPEVEAILNGKPSDDAATGDGNAE